MGERLLKRAQPHAQSAALMTPAMWGKVKSTVMEVDKCVHTLTESFEPFAPKACPSDQLLDHYADCLHFDERDPTQDRRPYLDELTSVAATLKYKKWTVVQQRLYIRVHNYPPGQLSIMHSCRVI
ncbi:unnamed protein product [Cyclocybe aegerita]|uniref:Uncharacterized protein n=1 Tax=Cyclocybe aegerita TaxID=1973307 RepID=A0A8S0X5D5_CYCAE|nr:unnamed protein product [Cyclocybe aegerita]